MAKILSQEEVDALLSTVNEEEQEPRPSAVGQTPAREKIGDKKVSVYNFRRPDRVSKEQLRSLHYLHDRFARNFSSSLSAYLRTLTEVNLVSVEQLTYAEFILSLPDPTYFNAVSMQPLDGSSILEINPQILFPIIDKILGGKGENFGGSLRSITDIERTLIEGVVRLILRDLEDAWKQIVEMKMGITATETSPQLVQVVAPNEVVVLIVLEVRVADSKGYMNFCIPAIVIEPIAHRFTQDWYADRTKTSVNEVRKIKLNLLRTRVNCQAEISGNKISARDFLTMRSGDLIRLRNKENDEFGLYLNGVLKFNVYPVQQGDKKCVQVTNRVFREFKNEQ